MRYILAAMLVALVSLLGFLIFRSNSAILPNADGHIQSLSYNPLDKNKNIISPEKIANDVRIFKEHNIRKIRLYAAKEAEAVLEHIKGSNLKIDLGLWLSQDLELNKTEIETTKKLLSKYKSNIANIIAGNEVLLREDLTEDQLIDYIKRIRSFARGHSVTTAEPWHIWTKYPKLISNIDVIYVHILPYWEGIDESEVLKYTIKRYNEVVKLGNHKPVYIGEFGWPTRGYNNRDADPSIRNAAEINRQFITYANEHKIKFNIIEAFDSPFKGDDEGSVGSYWGMFDLHRNLKYSLEGAIITDPIWEGRLVASVLLSWIIIVIGLRKQRLNYQHAATYGFASAAVSFGVVAAAAYPFVNYMNFGIWLMWGVSCLLLIPLTTIMLAKVNEIFRITLGRETERLIPLDLRSDRQPFVSIHVPAYKENPQVLLETIESLSKLNYDNYEVLIIINNTPDDKYKTAIKETCLLLPKFKYLDITCGGFKAGALNEALKQTHCNAEIIAVIDADYTVKSNWLRDLVPLFEDPKVAIVQAPQDHRDSEGTLLAQAMNAEYAGFFDIGMIQRNEDNAIIVHGTMVMVRQSALNEVGGWGTDTICEDTELGLRLFEAGYSAYYTNRRYGYGLLPDTYEAFRVQRHRWAYGCIQIIKKHWSHMTPKATTLSDAQKRHFVAGWFYWLSDAIGIVASALNLLWVPVILLIGVTIPTLPLTVPIIAAFFITILHSAVLYKARVKASVFKIALSSMASMSLQFVMFKAIFDGCIKDNLPFKRTEKGGNTKKKSKLPIKIEICFAVLLVISVFSLIYFNSLQIREIYFYAATLAVQSIPFLAAILMWLLDISRHKS